MGCGLVSVYDNRQPDDIARKKYHIAMFLHRFLRDAQYLKSTIGSAEGCPMTCKKWGIVFFASLKTGKTVVITD